MIDQLTIIRPDDWHVHLRDGDALKETVAATAKDFSRAVVMPNLVPPVVTVQEAKDYKARIIAHRPAGNHFSPLMTLYLTDNTTPELVHEVKHSADIVAFKLYPAGATTNSESGVTDIMRIEGVLEAMEECDVPLLVHGEVTNPDVDIFDREKIFLERILIYLIERFPRLRIVMEHITTADSVAFIRYCGDQVAATITAHHLLYDRNKLLVGGVKPHYYCLPILKAKRHKIALLEAAVGDNPRFFLGTDSAPHVKSAKESNCGCAGCYTSPIAIAMYAEAFESMDALDKLEAFASLRGADFYRLPHHKETITLVKEPWEVPKNFMLGSEQVIPLRAGEVISWQVKS